MSLLVVVLFFGALVASTELSGTGSVKNLQSHSSAATTVEVDHSDSTSLSSCRYEEIGVPYRNLTLNMDDDQDSVLPQEPVLSPSGATDTDVPDNEEFLNDVNDELADRDKEVL